MPVDSLKAPSTHFCLSLTTNTDLFPEFEKDCRPDVAFNLRIVFVRPVVYGTIWKWKIDQRQAKSYKYAPVAVKYHNTVR